MPEERPVLDDQTISSDDVYHCVDRLLPAEYVAKAREDAIKENPANYAPLKRGAIEKKKLWKPGRTLRVRYMDGDPRVHAKVSAVFPEWSQYANLTFELSNDWDAEIRISFLQPGSWSYIGTDAQQIPNNKPTMNYGWLKPDTADSEYQRVVIHEFGHALGMIHEHQNPSGAIPWNKEVVYSYYAGSPNFWSREQTDRNLFLKYDRDKTNYTEFDRDSIMLYPIQQRFTNGDFEVGWNRGLSEVDKTFIASQYPGVVKLENPLIVDGSPVTTAIGNDGELDLYMFEVSHAGRYVIETEGRTDVIMSLFGPNDSSVFLEEDDDSGARLNARIRTILHSGIYTVHVRHFSKRRTGEYSIFVKRE